MVNGKKSQQNFFIYLGFGLLPKTAVDYPSERIMPMLPIHHRRIMQLVFLLVLGMLSTSVLADGRGSSYPMLLIVLGLRTMIG
jgi:hypothetical protein